MQAIEMAKFVGSNGKFLIVDESDFVRNLMDNLVVDLNQENEIDASDLLVEDFEEGVLISSDGYRGKINYEGVVKYKGVWYLYDIVNEGVLMKLDNQKMCKLLFVDM